MSEIDFSKELKDLNGTPIPLAKDKPEPLTLKKVCIEALMAQFADESNLPGEEKMRRYDLALQIHNATVLDLESENIALLKKLTGKGYGPLIVGQAWKMLEGKNGP